MKPWKEFLETNTIEEDAPANAAGPMETGNIAGLGTGKNEPGFKPRKEFDGRTGPYRKHRKQLEAAREKREERRIAKEKQFADDIQNKTLKMSWPSVVGGPVPDTALPMAALANKKKSFKKK